MDIKGNPETLREATRSHHTLVLGLPLVHTGVDGCNDTFQDLERVPGPAEVSAASAVKGRRGEGVSRGHPSLGHRLASAPRRSLLDAGGEHRRPTAVRGTCSPPRDPP